MLKLSIFFVFSSVTLSEDNPLEYTLKTWDLSSIYNEGIKRKREVSLSKNQNSSITNISVNNSGSIVIVTSSDETLSLVFMERSEKNSKAENSSFNITVNELVSCVIVDYSCLFPKEKEEKKDSFPDGACIALVWNKNSMNIIYLDNSTTKKTFSAVCFFPDF